MNTVSRQEEIAKLQHMLQDENIQAVVGNDAGRISISWIEGTQYFEDYAAAESEILKVAAS